MRIVRLLLWILVVASSSAVTTHAGVTPAMQKAIRAATFEVVRKKPILDPLEYEKPLPLELLPYTERTDAYESIGTAFSLGNNTYVTAAHVLTVAVNSQYGPPSLRASDGAVYSIGQIKKFSDFKDFAIFSLEKDPQPTGFEVNRTPQVDDPVLAVGNALGDGIVIRDGLFTSETAEDQDGRWKWIRFSAAASPGNSGGPLLDATGKVIGIVIGKSPNENLNYSLPIREALDAPEDKATFDQRLVTRFLILRNTHTYTYKDEFKLPLGWAEFSKAYEEVAVHHSEQARSELLRTYDEKTFPKGSGTESLLFDLDAEFAPRIIVQQTDNTWSADSPGYQNADLPGDGYVSVGAIPNGGLSLLKLHRSDSATDDVFYSNSKGFMDIALKGLNITRTVGQDNVRVTSLGAAVSDSIHTDRYGRKWQQRIWPLPYLDAYIVGMLLPTPDGYAALLQYSPAPLLRFAKSQSNVLVDYVDVSYSGTIAQWQAHLKRRALLPLGFSDIKLEVGKDLTLRTKRFVLSVPTSVLPADSASELALGMGFMRDGDHVVWDVGSAQLYIDTQQKSYVSLWRQKQAPPTAKIDLRNKFTTIQSRRSPYDSQTSRETTETFVVSSAIDAPGKTTGKISPDLVYGLTLGLEGSPATTDLLSKHRALLGSIKVLEVGEAAEVAPLKTAQDDSINNAKAKSREQIQQMLKFADATSDGYGIDSRGRTLAQDIREFVTQPMEQTMAQTTGATAEGYQTWVEAKKHSDALEAYWPLVQRLNTNREVWSAFLEANHLDPGTAHSAEIKALEAKLSSLLKGAPSAEWATQANALTEAYLAERKTIVSTLAPSFTGAFSSRKSACPAPSEKTSGTQKVAFAPNADALPDNYPAASRRRHEEGTIKIVINVDETGCATGARIVGSSGFKALDAAALELYESMRFLPAERDGKAVADSATLPVNYKITDW